MSLNPPRDVFFVTLKGANEFQPSYTRNYSAETTTETTAISSEAIRNSSLPE